LVSDSDLRLLDFLSLSRFLLEELLFDFLFTDFTFLSFLLFLRISLIRSKLLDSSRVFDWDWDRRLDLGRELCLRLLEEDLDFFLDFLSSSLDFFWGISFFFFESLFFQVLGHIGLFSRL
jgi:hypothetical protein